jgi:hypothetical protein
VQAKERKHVGKQEKERLGGESVLGSVRTVKRRPLHQRRTESAYAAHRIPFAPSKRPFFQSAEGTSTSVPPCLLVFQSNLYRLLYTLGSSPPHYPFGRGSKANLAVLSSPPFFVLLCAGVLQDSKKGKKNMCMEMGKQFKTFSIEKPKRRKT